MLVKTHSTQWSLQGEDLVGYWWAIAEESTKKLTSSELLAPILLLHLRLWDSSGGGGEVSPPSFREGGPPTKGSGYSWFQTLCPLNLGGESSRSKISRGWADRTSLKNQLRLFNVLALLTRESLFSFSWWPSLMMANHRALVTSSAM